MSAPAPDLLSNPRVRAAYSAKAPSSGEPLAVPPPGTALDARALTSRDPTAPLRSVKGS
jgi:hypothetical protein